MDNGLLTYKMWAPADALWTPWAKPSLFMNPRAAVPIELRPLAWAEAARKDTIIIIDLPSEYGLLEALSLVPFGYRPVPLYNCVEATPNSQYTSVINVDRIAELLFSGADLVYNSRFPLDAPPAFVLDSLRMEFPNLGERYGKFDNRWCIFPQDMPSADFLVKHGVRRVVLRADSLQNDLSHILKRWQDSGVEIYLHDGAYTAPRMITVNKPSLFKSLSYRFKTMRGLRRNSAGGFGGYIADPSESSGYGHG